MELRKPDFIIIGAPKAGTTSLADWLSQHPEVFMSPIKEPGFFTHAGRSRNHDTRQQYRRPGYATTWEEYLKLFQDAKPGQTIGEATTHYLESYQSPGLIKSFVPNIKQIAILRNPVERIYSHYLMAVTQGAIDLPFGEALKAEKDSLFGFGYKPIGLYAKNLKRYGMFFPSNQIYICFFDDLINSPLSFYNAICSFLGINATFSPIFRKLNDYGIYHFGWLQKMIFSYGYGHPIRKLARFLLPLSGRKWIRSIVMKNKPITKPEMAADIRKELIDYYCEDILELQKMVGRDLTEWLE